MLAGGQSLMPMLNMRFVLPDHVVDLNRIGGLAGITRDARGVRIGALTRQSDLEFDDALAAELPLVRQAVVNVGHRQTRNRGTIGGSLCHLDPSAELVTVAASYDAAVEVAGPAGTRDIAFADFALGFMTPAIEPDEIVTAVTFRPWTARTGSAFVEFARRHGDYAIVSAAAILQDDGDGRIVRAVLTLGGVSYSAVRMNEVEASLIGRKASPELFRTVPTACSDIEALDDAHVPASYRRRLATTLARRALEQAHAALIGRQPEAPRRSP